MEHHWSYCPEMEVCFWNDES